MYQVYVERNYSELSRNLLGEYSSLEEARAVAKKAIVENDELNYIIEETDGHFNSYGDLVTTVVEESQLSMQYWQFRALANITQIR